MLSPASSTSTDFQVRPAVASDLPAVHALIVELAVYERAENEVTLQVETLETDFKAGCFEVSVATFEDKVIGMALHHPRYSTWKGVTWYLEDLVVTEDWRGRGVGKALFHEVVQAARRHRAQRLEWQVLDWNAPAIGFYQTLNASLSSTWLNGRLTRDQLDAWNAKASSEPSTKP